jgi:hypothetical protein
MRSLLPSGFSFSLPSSNIKYTTTTYSNHTSTIIFFFKGLPYTLAVVIFFEGMAISLTNFNNNIKAYVRNITRRILCSDDISQPDATIWKTSHTDRERLRHERLST